jgi:AraC-like DNA-binding protein
MSDPRAGRTRPGVVRRAPAPPLRPFVSLLWAMDDAGPGFAPAPEPGARLERVLPTGAMHLVFRLAAPLRVFASVDGSSPSDLGYAVVGGARTSFYVRDVSGPSRSVGAMLRPGAAALLFGGSAAELAGTHTALGALWGSDAARALERLQEARTPEQRLEILEAILAARLPRVRGLHPAVAMALERVAEMPRVAELVRASGYSHRRFVELFEDAVGLTPKRYARVLRLQRVLRRLASAPAVPLAELALGGGYGDQSHLSREVLEMTGLSPARYRALGPVEPNHVPVPSRP